MTVFLVRYGSEYDCVKIVGIYGTRERAVEAIRKDAADKHRRELDQAKWRAETGRPDHTSDGYDQTGGKLEQNADGDWFIVGGEHLIWTITEGPVE